MLRFASLAAGLVLTSAALVNAQSSLPRRAAVNAVLAIQGCVAQIQRDGSLAPKPGATATPATATQEANNPNPTGVYQLLDARPAGARDTKSTTYALTGHEAELAKLEGQRVEVAGAVLPTIGDAAAGKLSGAADATQRIRVSSVKKIEGRCSAATK